VSFGGPDLPSFEVLSSVAFVSLLLLFSFDSIVSFCLVVAAGAVVAAIEVPFGASSPSLSASRVYGGGILLDSLFPFWNELVVSVAVVVFCAAVFWLLLELLVAVDTAIAACSYCRLLPIA
jgi:hypothetical protein